VINIIIHSTYPELAVVDSVRDKPIGWMLGSIASSTPCILWMPSIIATVMNPMPKALVNGSGENCRPALAACWSSMAKVEARRNAKMKAILLRPMVKFSCTEARTLFLDHRTPTGHVYMSSSPVLTSLLGLWSAQTRIFARSLSDMSNMVRVFGFA